MAIATALYFLGAVVVLAATAYMIIADQLTRENLAFWIVFPLAWVFGYWGVALPLLSCLACRSLMTTIERIAEKVKTGQPVKPEDEATLVDELTVMAAAENNLPTFVLRPWVRRAVRHMLSR